MQIFLNLWNDALETTGKSFYSDKHMNKNQGWTENAISILYPRSHSMFYPVASLNCKKKSINNYL